MSRVTITEALAEIKLIEKKVEKKKEIVLGNLTRIEQNQDPFKSEGGSEAALNKEVQAVDDLYRRLVMIRSAVAIANLNETVTLNEETKSVYEWLTWKREVASKEIDFANIIHTRIRSDNEREKSNPRLLNPPGNEEAVLAKLICNLDYSKFVRKHEALSDKLETLDGQLSLKNATVTVVI